MSASHLVQNWEMPSKAFKYVTFHGKTYINTSPFNGLKRLLVVSLPLKRFRKSLEALERPFKIFTLAVYSITQVVKSVFTVR